VALVKRAAGGIDLTPGDGAWPFLPANAGARVIVHPGLDHMGDPVRSALRATASPDLLPLTPDGLEQLDDGMRVVVSGPVPLRSGRA
jgi:hypothetical protein